jgi:hypothetical protein
MPRCVTCGAELHPERAKKYDYCTSPECQEKNFQGLTMVAVAQNKAAEEFLILDERTREDLASGKYRDQRRGFYGSLASTPPQAPQAPASQAPTEATQAKPGAPKPEPPNRAGTTKRRAARQARPAVPARRQWTASQERLALLYNQQGLRPAEIATKLGVSEYLATQIVLAARHRRKA